MWLPAKPARHAASLPEVIIVLGIIGLLFSLFMPAIQQARAQSRLHACRDRLRQLSLAAHAYEATYGRFPYTSMNSNMKYGEKIVRLQSVSPQNSMMAFIDPAIANRIDRSDKTADHVWADHPVIYLSKLNRPLGKLVIPALLCPSDRAQPGGTSFRGNFGISPFLFPPSRKTGSDNEERFVERGAFVNGQALLAAEFLDGLSQTAMFSERPIGDGNPGRYDPWRDRFSTETQVRSSSQVIETCRSLASPSPKDHDSYGGWNWLLGGIRHSWYDHLLTPNSDIPDCMLSFAAAGGGQGLATARSFHEGGVNVAMADGSARFISSSIDDAVWRALGTRNGSD